MSFLRNLLFLILGCILGFLAHTCSPIPKDDIVLVKSDSIVVHDTIYYTKTDFKTERVTETEKDTVTITVFDTVYIRLPREHYYTESSDMRIWHSGIDSRIDSVMNIRETKIISDLYVEKKKHHAVGARADLSFHSASVGAFYEYTPFNWINLNASVGYDFFVKQPYLSVGTKINIHSW